MQADYKDASQKIDPDKIDLAIKKNLYKKPIRFQNSDKGSTKSKAIFTNIHSDMEDQAPPEVDELDSIDNFKLWQ